MSLHPWNDNIKVKLDKPDEFGFGAHKGGFETGVVVEVPSTITYVAMHSMVLESSFMSIEKLDDFLKEVGKLRGKRIIWQSFQDRGRVYQEGDDMFVNLKMTDIMGYADEVSDPVEFVDLDKFKGGSFSV